MNGSGSDRCENEKTRHVDDVISFLVFKFSKSKNVFLDDL